MKPRAGKHDTSVLAAGIKPVVGMRRVSLNRKKLSSCAAITGCKSISKTGPKKRRFCNIIGGQEDMDGVWNRVRGVMREATTVVGRGELELKISQHCYMGRVGLGRGSRCVVVGFPRSDRRLNSMCRTTNPRTSPAQQNP